LEAIQIAIHHPISLVVGGSFQSIDHIRFHVNREEVQLELLFKVFSGLDGENTSVHFLTDYVFGLFGSVTTFEECESPENSFLFVVELLRG